MKKVLSLLVVMFVSFNNVSCSKDDGPAAMPIQEASIVGNWNLTATGEYDSTTNVYDMNEHISACGSAYYDQWLFNSSGSLRSIRRATSGSDCLLLYNDYSWTKTGDTLRVVEGPDDYTDYIIVSITNTTLKVRTDWGNDMGGFYDVYEYTKSSNQQIIN